MTGMVIFSTFTGIVNILTIAPPKARFDRAIGFGAKGNTLLNRCRLPLAYIVDDNPMKHGYLTPGQHIPIRSPASLTDEAADLAFLLLAWNFAAEIVGKIRAWRPGRADSAIHYVPRVGVHSIFDPPP
jgi:methylation protein EvaC